MTRVSHLIFHDTDSILVEEDDSMLIIPKAKDDISNLRPHFFDKDFLLSFDSGFNAKSYAFIQRMKLESLAGIRLYPQFIVRDALSTKFTFFEISGDAIDDFFSPAAYFYKRAKKEGISDFECLYHSEKVDEWTIAFEGHRVKISLSFGDILRLGIASDLKLHARLTVRFSRTDDIQFIYRLYLLIVRFMKLIRYEVNCGTFRVELYDKKKDQSSHNGSLYDYSLRNVKFNRGAHNMDYTCYKPYIKRFIQFAADNPEYSFNHFPSDGVRYLGIHYSSLAFLSIFSAFENECGAQPKLFEKTNTSEMDNIRRNLLDLVDKNISLANNDNEIAFVNLAKDRIMQLGTQYGQKQRIVNAYHVMAKSLDSSIENIFILPELRRSGHLCENDINEIARVLSEQRGKIAHGSGVGSFSDLDARRIVFLEILTYAMMLKRVGLAKLDIERVIGVVFTCNFIVFEEQFH